MQGIINKLFQGWHLFHNYSKAYNERIWMLWKGDMEVKLVDDTDQSITCKVYMQSMVEMMALKEEVYGTS